MTSTPALRKLIVAEHISLDGVIQAPGGPDEDPSGGFTLGGWSAPYADEASGKEIGGLFGQPFELLLGRRTYDIWAAYWPHVKAGSQAGGIAGLFNAGRKHVATHHGETLAWHNSHALQGEVTDAVRALKRQEGPHLHTWGSSTLVRQLLAAGLVDELHLMVYPVLLGNGKRLFDDTAQAAAFTLTRSITSGTGVLLVRYERAGAVRTGSFKD